MRFSNVLAVIAALTVTISAMSLEADASVSARDTQCPKFCKHSYQCCGFCVSNLRPGLNRTTHRSDSFSSYVSMNLIIDTIFGSSVFLDVRHSALIAWHFLS
jgi:hypothetical protein